MPAGTRAFASLTLTVPFVLRQMVTEVLSSSTFELRRRVTFLMFWAQIVGKPVIAPEPAATPAPAKTTVQTAPAFSLVSAAYAADAAAAVPAVTELFRGVFAQLQLPVDLALDGLDLDGDILLPPTPGGPAARAHLTLAGGGLSAGHEGRFTLDLTVAFAGDKLPVNNLAVRATIVAAMDTPRSFSRLAVEPSAVATGAQFPSGVKLTAGLTATRGAAGEIYVLTLASAAQQLGLHLAQCLQVAVQQHRIECNGGAQRVCGNRNTGLHRIGQAVH